MSKKTELPPATLAQVKAAWEAHPAPSIRAVIEALREAGYKCSITTLQRWKKNGWQKNGSAARALKSKIKRAKVAAQEAMKVADSVDSVSDDDQSKMAKRAKELDAIEQDSELARLAMRKSLIAQIVLCEQITLYAELLVEKKKEKVAGLIDALKGPAASTTIVFQPNEQSANGDDAMVVDGRVLRPPSEAALAIEAFFEREGVSA